MLEYGVGSVGWWSFDRAANIYERHMRAWHVDNGYLYRVIAMNSHGGGPDDGGVSHRDDEQHRHALVVKTASVESVEAIFATIASRCCSLTLARSVRVEGLGPTAPAWTLWWKRW